MKVYYKCTIASRKVYYKCTIASMKVYYKCTIACTISVLNENYYKKSQQQLRKQHILWQTS